MGHRLISIHVLIQAPLYLFLMLSISTTLLSIHDAVSVICSVGIFLVLVIYKVLEKKSEGKKRKKILFALPFKVLLLVALIFGQVYVFFHGLNTACRRLEDSVYQSFVIGKAFYRVDIPNEIRVTIKNACFSMKFDESGGIVYLQQNNIKRELNRMNWGSWLKENIYIFSFCKDLNVVVRDGPVRGIFEIKLSKTGAIESVSGTAHWD